MVNKGFLPNLLMVLLFGCEPVTLLCASPCLCPSLSSILLNSPSVYAKETAAIALWPLLVVAMLECRRSSRMVKKAILLQQVLLHFF